MYEVTDPESGRTVALKTLRQDSEGDVTRFMSEFHALAGTRHPNLVRLFELGVDEGLPFFTMELLDGVPFHHWIGSPGTDGLTQEQRKRLDGALRQLVCGLEHLHRAGLLHRDLKPSNVLVLRDGTVKILDLGLAVPLSQRGEYEASMPGAVIGTLAYMAPEQAEGKDLTPAADWYSVGVMLFECLCGKKPFEAASWGELLRLKRAGAPSMPSVYEHDRLAELVRQLLHPDPAQRPAGDRILAALQERRPLAAPAQHSLVGRSNEQRRLLAGLEKTLASLSAHVTCLSGSSGVGKSELARWLYEHLRDDPRVQVYRGRCYETVLLPYKVWDAIHLGLARRLLQLDEMQRQAIAPLEAELLGELWPVFSSVFPARTKVRRLSAQERRRRAFRAFRELLLRAGPLGAAARPLPVLVLDDLQWADLDSVWLMLELFREEPPPMWMVWVYREEDRADSQALRLLLSEMETLTASGRLTLEKVEVRALDRHASYELARQQLGPLSRQAELVQRVAAESGGNPLLVCQLATYALKTCGDYGDCTLETLSSELSLESVVNRLKEQLPAEAKELVDTIACAGRPVRGDAVAKATGMVSNQQPIWDLLLHHNLVRSIGYGSEQRWDAYHDRVRAAIFRQLPPPRRQQIHARLASVLCEEEPVDHEFVGQQYLAAERPAEAAPHLLEAARGAAGSLAFDRAVRLYRMALDCPLDAAQLPHAWAELAQALANVGRCRESAEAFLRASQQAGQAPDWNYRCQAAWNYLASGHIAEGTEVLRRVLRDAGLSLPAHAWAAVAELGYWMLRLRLPEWRTARRTSPKLRQQLEVCWSAVAGLSLVDPLRAATLTARLVWLSRHSDDVRHQLRALAVYIAHRTIGGTRVRHRSARLLVQLRSLVEKHPSIYADAVLALTEGIVAHLEGRWHDTWTRCDQAAEWFTIAEYPDVSWEINTAQTFAMWARLYGGQLQHLKIQQPAARRYAMEREDLFARWNSGARVLAMVGLAEDRPDDVRRALDDDERLLPEGRFHVQHHNILLARVMCDLYEGRASEAWQCMEQGWRHYRGALLSRVQQVRIDFWKMYGLAALAVLAQAVDAKIDSLGHGTVPVLKERVRASIRRLRAERAPWAAAIAQLLGASLASVEEPPARVAEQFLSAAQALDSAHMDLFAAAASWRSWQWQRAAGGSSLAAPKAPPGVQNWTRWLNWLAPTRCPQ
ncbi:MAG: hypothetical protein KatS3mg109_1815 [Pirellulaceae bacterium]|nr:MAG: hypothetical protein KatS3mg109_1815 [Pirellulaceae bacterium]